MTLEEFQEEFRALLFRAFCTPGLDPDQVCDIAAHLIETLATDEVDESDDC